MTVLALLPPVRPWRFAYVLSAFLFVRHLKGVWTLKDRALDPMLPLLVKASALFAVLGGTGFLF